MLGVDRVRISPTLRREAMQRSSGRSRRSWPLRESGITSSLADRTLAQLRRREHLVRFRHHVDLGTDAVTAARRVLATAGADCCSTPPEPETPGSDPGLGCAIVACRLREWQPPGVHHVGSTSRAAETSISTRVLGLTARTDVPTFLRGVARLGPQVPDRGRRAGSAVSISPYGSVSSGRPDLRQPRHRGS